MLFTNSNLFANDLVFAPPILYSNGLKIVPIDISNIDVKWNIDSKIKSIVAIARVTFSVKDSGHPMLMLNPNSKAYLNGKQLQVEKLTQEFAKKRNLYFLHHTLEKGESITLEFSYNFQSFSHPDLGETKRHSHILPVRYYAHSFTEHGIPTNLQYDHYSVTLKLILDKKNKELLVITNGKIRNKLNNHYIIDFPSSFTGASFYIDIVKNKNIVKNDKIMLKSIDGKRTIPILVYAETDDSAVHLVDSFAKILEKSFHNLESKFGPFPFDKIIFKPNNRLDRYSGGAFAGAMALPDSYLEHVSHELGHSYFGHYFSPANGNDQWIFEGMGTWLPLLKPVSYTKDKNYYNFHDLSLNLYDIWKTFDAHIIGRSILQTIDAKIKAESLNPKHQKEGLIEIFKVMFKTLPPQTLSTRKFSKILSKETGIDFEKHFAYYFKSY